MKRKTENYYRSLPALFEDTLLYSQFDTFQEGHWIVLEQQWIDLMDPEVRQPPKVENRT